VTEERYEGLGLARPAEGFELYRRKNVENHATRGWSGLYWARRNELGPCTPSRHPGGRGVLGDGRRLPEGGLRGALRVGEPLTLEPLI
jgi:hypothetical protein